MDDNATPSPTPSPDEPKAGYRTTEFWLKILAILLTALYASGIIPTDSTTAKVVAIVATMLGALGYTVSRTLAKS